MTLDATAAQVDPRDVDLLDLDAALGELALFDPRKSRMAELRFFGGLSLEDVAYTFFRIDPHLENLRAEPGFTRLMAELEQAYTGFEIARV